MDSPFGPKGDSPCEKYRSLNHVTKDFLTFVSMCHTPVLIQKYATENKIKRMPTTAITVLAARHVTQPLYVQFQWEETLRF